jgi:ATP phosphoribosyltransferase
MNNLRIGVPSKGRLAELAGELLKQAGLSFRRQERSLFARCKDLPVEVNLNVRVIGIHRPRSSGGA